MGRTAAIQTPMTVDDFLVAYANVEERYELVDGEPVAMGSANYRHNGLMANLLRRIAERLDGSPCKVLAANMGLSVSAFTYRLPDLGIYCDPREIGPDNGEAMTLAHPKVLIEILSKSTERSDYVHKLDEYQAIASVDTIVFVHRTRDAFTTFERLSETEWRTIVHLPGQPLVLRDPAMTIPAAEVFAGV